MLSILLFHHEFMTILFGISSIEVLHSRMFCLLLLVILSKLRPWFGLVRRTNAIQQCNEGCGMSAKSLRGERPHNHRAKYIYPVLFRVYCPAFYCPKTKGVLQLYYYCY